MGPSKSGFIAIKGSNRRHRDSNSQTQRVVQARLCSKIFNPEVMTMGKKYFLRSTKDICNNSVTFYNTFHVVTFLKSVHLVYIFACVLDAIVYSTCLSRKTGLL